MQQVGDVLYNLHIAASISNSKIDEHDHDVGTVSGTRPLPSASYHINEFAVEGSGLLFETCPCSLTHA